MKVRTISILSIALVIGLLLSNSGMGRVKADDRHDRVCSNKTLNGPYGFYRAGHTSAGTLAAVGIVIYDGNGNNTATQSISRDGVFTLDQTTFGQYEVAPDCTGRGFLNGVEISRTVIVDGGREIYLFSENTGNAVYGVAKKIRAGNNENDR
jgi:hypothetical protein